MASLNTLCSACLGALHPGLEDVLEELMSTVGTHHAGFADFRDAVAHECYICVRLWDSIGDESLARWSEDPASWKPLRCWIERRPWAPEWYGAIYWHIRYLVFEFRTGMDDLKYRGNVFCLCPRKNNKASALEAAFRNFESSTSSVKVHDQAYDWYRSCRESHKLCQRLGPQGKFAPSRLIDVGVEGDKSWKLCLYPKDIADPPNYLTMSYRWAQKPTVLLLSSTIDSFRQGALIESLPRTFRDAITVARHCSFRYLWIDSLCIVQDSPDDWARESLQMHEIYANSSFNIAASASDNPDGGLFRSRKAKETLMGCIKIDSPNGTHKEYDIWDQFYMNRLTQGPLTSRGWVFQERVLSPRVLHFSRNQIVWECFEMNKCEMFPKWSPCPTEIDYSRGLKTVYAFFDSRSPDPFAKQEEKIMSVDVYEQWNHLIKAYSQCILTCPDDRLIAMSGIAEMYKKHTGDEYLAGLWKSRLIEGLNWVVTNPAARPQNHLRVPSWSWAAVNSAVLPQKTNLPRDDDLIEVINAVVNIPKTAAGWQHINGSIELRGCVSTATIHDVTQRSFMAENVPLKLVGLASQFFAYPDTTDTTFEEDQILYLLPLRSTLRNSTSEEGTEAEKHFGTLIIILEGVIMEPVPEVEASYRRIGRFVVDSIDHTGFFGLLAVPSMSNATLASVVMDDTQTSIFTLV